MFRRLTLPTVISITVLAVMLFPSPLIAQDSYWGATASFVPKWDRVPELYEQIWDVDDLRPEGAKEFRIGVVRGSDLGGDWSVTFVRNWFRTDQVIDQTFPAFADFDETGPVPGTEVGLVGSLFTVPGNVEVTGVKFEKFTPYVTIRDRVQVGLTYGIGIGSIKGTVVERRFETELDFPPPNFNPVVTNQSETITEFEVKEAYTPGFVPIGNVEAAVAFILAPGLKARVSGGFNYPNTQVFSFTVNYLIGAQ